MIASIEKTRKSKYDLSEYAILKVPKSQYQQITQISDNTNLHWSELARRILDWWLRQPEKKVSE